MPFIYTIKHNLPKQPISVKDLGKDGWCSMPPANSNVESQRLRHLHLMFSKDEIMRSRGLRDAISCGWFIPVEIEFEDTSKTTEIEDLKSQMANLISLTTKMMEGGLTLGNNVAVAPAQSGGMDTDILAKIAKDIQRIKKNTIGEEIEGYEPLTPEQVAIRGRGKINVSMLKDSDINLKRESIEVNLDDLVDNLDD